MEIEIQNVSYSYNKYGYKENKILENIDMILKKGKITSIIGANGSGKSTLAQLISGILTPISGKILVDGIDINKNNLNKKIGYVSQIPEIDEINQTVKEKLEFNLKLNNYKINQKDKKIKDSLFMVGLSDKYLTKRLIDLNLCDLKKIELASILLLNPKVLIVDELTTCLDKKTKLEFIKLLRILKNRYKKTILLISNDTDFILKITDYVYVLYYTHIVMHGNKIDVFRETDKLIKYNINIPNVIKFEDKVLKTKNIKLGYRDEINDLIKDIYRNVN